MGGFVVKGGEDLLDKQPLQGLCKDCDQTLEIQNIYWGGGYNQGSWGDAICTASLPEISLLTGLFLFRRGAEREGAEDPKRFEILEASELEGACPTLEYAPPQKS